MINRTAFIAGTFDGFHAGHLYLLEQAAKLGRLIVGLNTDKDVRARKGNNRPTFSFEKRKEALLKTGYVDEVLEFEGNDKLKELIVKIKPDFIITGRRDYKIEQVVGHDICKFWGGCVLNIPYSLGVSSTGNLQPKLHLTGGAGFIGSNMVRYLNEFGIRPIVYDDLANWKNLSGLNFEYRSINSLNYRIDDALDATLIHLGARVDTTEKMSPELWRNNVELSIQLVHQPFKKVIYASSAAIYGNETKDFTERINGLQPMNAYAFTKWYLDRELFQIRSIKKPVYGLRFFNVYGPGEDHKGDMKSVIYRFVKKVPPMFDPQTKSWDIFGDGNQARDFVHVRDVCSVIKFFIDEEPESGIYNVGSGVATTFNEIAQLVDPNVPINYSPLPDKLKDQYQFYTCADLTKLRAAGYKKEFISITEGIKTL